MDSKSWVGAAIGDARGAGAVPMGGRYKVLSQLGEGGFGVVYLADQTEPVRRRVALKVLKLALASPSMRARFEAEQQALAVMDHPGLAKVFDAGTTPDGQPYFAMEYAPGEPLTAFCDKRTLPIRTRLTLLSQICDAVHHAHMKGLIHRDLKPANILVGETDEGYRPKVIDFGIAKAVTGHGAAAPTETQFGQFVGTPVYMSPEQADGGTSDIDIRSDLYSLGVILYELLVGGTPIESETLRKSGLARLHQTIVETTAPRPSVKLAKAAEARRLEITAARATDARALSKQLSRDLDWITMRCLEKDRTRRYESASALAADLRRYLGGEAVLAGPPGARYRIGKFVRRHRVAVGAAAVALVGLIAFGISMTMLWSDAVLQQRRAQSMLDVLVTSLTSSDVSGEQAGATVTVGDFLKHVEGEVTTKLSDDPEIATNLRSTIGTVMTSLSDYDGAARNLTAVVDFRRAQAANGSRDDEIRLATALHEYGRALFFQQRLPEARACYEEALAIRRRLLDPNDVLIGRTLIHLGAACSAMGDPAASSSYADEGITRLRGAGETGQELLAGALFSRATSLAKSKKFDEARRFAEECVDVTIRAYPAEGANNWRIGRVLSLLADIEVASGRLDLAIVHQRRAVELVLPRYGQHHPTATNTQFVLARFLCEAATGSATPGPTDRVKDEALVEEALRMARAAAEGQTRNGGFPQALASSLDLISRISELRGDRATALAVSEQALKVLREQAPQAAEQIKTAQDRIARLQRAAATAP